MRWIAIIKELLKDVVVPLVAAGVVAFAAIKVAKIENKGEEDEKPDSSGPNGPSCCCGCSCRHCRKPPSDAGRPSKDERKDSPVGTPSGGGGDKPPTPGDTSGVDNRGGGWLPRDDE